MKKMVNVIVLVLILGVVIFNGNAAEPEKKHIKIGYQWHLVAPSAWLFVAKDKGWYKDAGLEVEIFGLPGSMANVSALQAGQVDFACPAANVLAKARIEGVKAKMLLCYVVQSEFGVIFLTDSGIKEPKDLEGKTLAAQPGSAELLLFPGFCKQAGIDSDKIQIKEVSSAVRFNLMVSGEVDGAIEFIPAIPTLEAKGYDISSIKYSDYDLPVYFNGICAMDKFIEENPEMVRKFIQACQKGLAWACDYPKEAVDIFLKYHPEGKGEDINLAYDYFKLSSINYQDEITREKGMGWMSEDKWKSTLDFTEVTFGVEIDFPPSEVYTNKFLAEKK